MIDLLDPLGVVDGLLDPLGMADRHDPWRGMVTGKTHEGYDRPARPLTGQGDR